MSRKKINIGLFGFGCVGQGLYDVLSKTPGLKANIQRICVKTKGKTRSIAEHHFTFDAQDILNDPAINVVVELIDDPDAAFQLVSEALRKRKAVVSANKKMIAEHFQELLTLQETYQTPFLYEAAVCASIPIIRNLEEYYDNDLLESISGIVNGSTNYILTKTGSEEISYQDALKEAQAKGYAESNPELDTGGYDAKYKLQILVAHAFGLIVKPEALYHHGINELGPLELNYAKEKKLKVKLTANAFRNQSGKISAFVVPQFIRPEEKLYQVDDVYNAVVTKTAFADTQFFSGKGAGAHPTASAVLSDLSAITYDYRYEYKKRGSNDSLEQDQAIKLRGLLRFSVQDASYYARHLNTIEESYANQEEGYFTGEIGLNNLRKLQQERKGNFNFILLSKN